MFTGNEATDEMAIGTCKPRTLVQSHADTASQAATSIAAAIIAMNYGGGQLAGTVTVIGAPRLPSAFWTA